MNRTHRLRAQISLAVTIGALVVALGVFLLLINTVKLHSSAQATSRSDAYAAAVVDVERNVVDAETGLRGYVITGRRLFLAPTRTARAGLPASLERLRDAASSDGAFAAQSQSLAAHARAYMNTYVPAVVALAARNPARARSFAVTLQGKTLVDGIRGQAASLERLLSARERARQRTAKSEAAHATTEAIVVLVLLTGLTLLLGLVLGRLVISRDRARRRSEETADVLRASLLPDRAPSIPGCEVAVRFLPAHAGELVGGDFYDVYPVGPGQWAIVVGDVCGKGADAAAVTAMARWTLRSLAGSPVTPVEALQFLNRTMLGLDLDGRFITVAYVLLTVEADGARASLACAGHPPAIFVPSDGAPAQLPARGTLLGIWPDIELETCEVELGRGDGIVLYTDGVSDPGPGPERIPVQALHGLPREADAGQLADRLRSLAGDPSAAQRDDIAIL
ncbi:MAG: SpoIIE family protein phosphatase, partial [Solirubrobacteraceae bacterium]